MNYSEFKKMIDKVPELKTLQYKIVCRAYFHPKCMLLGLTSIGNDESNLIRVPSRAINKYGTKSLVSTICKEAFAGCEKITDVFLPATINEISAGAFKGCSALKRITIPKNIKIIHEGTFEGCNSLEDIYYEGSINDWKKVNIIHRKHEIEFGSFVPGTPVHEIKEEQLLHIKGNDAVLASNIHFNCQLSD